MSDTPTPVSRVFSEQMMTMLEVEKCFTDNKDQVDIHRLQNRIMDDGVIDIETFN